MTKRNKSELFIGQKFNRLKIISISSQKKKQKTQTYAKCLCDCGKETVSCIADVKRGKTRSCGCLAKEIARKVHYKGYKNLSGTYWANLKKGAKSRNIKVLLSVEEAYLILEKQNFTCPYTGLQLKLCNDSYWLENASLDRINSELDYTIENCQWIYKPINLMKQTMPHEEFLETCKKITEYQKETNGN